jgi:drug/metabolite transporter (DMT)-like permease
MTTTRPIDPGRAAPARHTHLDTIAIASLVACCLLWGLNQVAIKAVMPEVPSLIQLSVRSGLAAVLVLAWMRWRGVSFSLVDGTLAPGLLAGCLFAVEFACIFYGLRFTTAARSVVFINTSPFIVAILLAWLTPTERLRWPQLAGMLLAFGAIAQAFWEGFTHPSHTAAASDQLLGDALVLIGAMLWGLTTVVIRTSALRTAPPEKTLAYQLVVAALLAPVAAVSTGQAWPEHWSTLALGSMFYQGVIVTFASYLIWFWLLTTYPATKVQAFVFLSPVFGTVSASLLLGEPIGPRLLFGLLGVVAGLILMNWRRST